MPSLASVPVFVPQSIAPLAVHTAPSPASAPVLPSPANVRPGYQRNFPKWKIDEFDGDPLRWPRWSGQFLSTIDSADISVEEKLAYLQQLCIGKASHVVEPLVHSGASYYDVFARLRRRFGQPHVVVSAHLERLNQFPPLRMHNSEQLIEYALAVSSFMHVLQSQNYYEDLNGSTNLALVVQKLPPNLRESWSRHVVRSSLQRPTLLHFNSWLGVAVESHEYMRSTATPTPKTKPPENTKPKRQ